MPFSSHSSRSIALSDALQSAQSIWVLYSIWKHGNLYNEKQAFLLYWWKDKQPLCSFHRHSFVNTKKCLKELLLKGPVRNSCKPKRNTGKL